jgi:hypothetical protein
MWPRWRRSRSVRLVTIVISFAVWFGLGGVVSRFSPAGFVLAVVALFAGSLCGTFLGLALYIDHLRLRNRKAANWGQPGEQPALGGPAAYRDSRSPGTENLSRLGHPGTVTSGVRVGPSDGPQRPVAEVSDVG